MNEICQSDAAYAMGALDSRERREFERHLNECERCTESVGKLTSTMSAMATVPRDQAIDLMDDAESELPPLPADLVRTVTSLDAHRQKRDSQRRWGSLITAAAAGAVAASVVFLAIGGLSGLGGLGGSGGETSAPEGSPFTAASGTATSTQQVSMEKVVDGPLRAQVRLSSEAWGTDIVMTADYDPAAQQMGDKVTYVMYVRSGNQREQVASWTGTIGKPCALRAASRVPTTDIDSIEIEMKGRGAVIMEGKVAA